MKNSIKFIIPVIATIGVVMTVLMDNNSTGLLITFFYTPLLLVYTTLVLKSDLKNTKTRLNSTFLSVAILNTAVVLIYVLFKSMHWPFTGVLKILGTFVCIITLGVGLTYFLRNRKIISTEITFEIMILLFPSIIFIWSIIPYNIPPQLYDEYVELISESNNNIETLNKDFFVDSCQRKNLSEIRRLKAEIIKWSGGYDGHKLLSFYDRSCQFYIQESNIEKLDINPELKRMILNAKINGDAVFLLTQAESEVLTKKCP